MKLRIATRSSALAMAQSRQVADWLMAAHPGLECELAPVVTRGDRVRGPLAAVGGKGLFTAELEEALASGALECAVHSAKDLPAVMDDRFVIAATPRREDPRDALVVAQGRDPAQMLSGSAATVGTGSPRRAVQIIEMFPQANVIPIRGNVETRIGRVESGQFDAVVLAMAGLIRSGLVDRQAGQLLPLPAASFIPAAGQGVLAVQCRCDDGATQELLSALDDPATHAALDAERRVVAGLQAGCHSCLGVHVAPQAGGWAARGLVGAPGRREVLSGSACANSAMESGESLLHDLIRRGAMDLLTEGGA